MTMGGVEDEGHFVEVEAEPSSFRSRSSFLYITGSRIFLWHGCASSSISRKVKITNDQSYHASSAGEAARD